MLLEVITRQFSPPLSLMRYANTTRHRPSARGVRPTQGSWRAETLEGHAGTPIVPEATGNHLLSQRLKHGHLRGLQPAA